MPRKPKVNSQRNRIRDAVKAGIELSIEEWASQLHVKTDHIHVLLSQLRKEKFYVFSVLRDNGKRVVVQLDRETANANEADEFARLSDGVSIRYGRDINQRLDTLLNAMENCVDIYPLLELPVKERLLTTAQRIINYDYEQIHKLMADYRTANPQIAAGSDTAAERS